MSSYLSLKLPATAACPVCRTHHTNWEFVGKGGFMGEPNPRHLGSITGLAGVIMMCRACGHFMSFSECFVKEEARST